MKWDRWIALILVFGGAAWAGHSGVDYLQKLDAVREWSGEDAVRATDSPATASPNGKAADDRQDLTVIFPENERPRKGQHFADLIIPRLQAVMPVVEGTRDEELARGVGHFAGSVLPGEPDNAVLSGHRDTVFRRLGELQTGDRLLVRTTRGTFVYTITRTWVTDADDRTVIVSTRDPVLTLTTCYPFTFAGPAPERYIIRAELSGRETDDTFRPGQGG
ncbi:class D sortase [Staphylospora marina]|uniref:class D sortase n=1 Tax=Staphylospora marina TaxID=2490858 RepID=UPI000F5B9786|nr:class D sortase [Staphylospora marina]